MVADPDPSVRLRHTPLHPSHEKLGAKLVPFAGFSMPVSYEGVVAEHTAVRSRAGLFDVSHMGQLEIRGDGAGALCDAVTPTEISALPVGRAAYTALTTPSGGFVDDVLVYRLDERRLLMVVNAANTEKDLAWIQRHASTSGDATVEDRTDATARLALQGPRSRDVLAPLAEGCDARTMKFYRVAPCKVAGREAVVSRTGYTGEIGFEIFVSREDAGHVWSTLIEEGRAHGLAPAGLGARDTLRLEAGLPLYGNDIDETTDVLTAGLEFIVSWDKGEFIGRDALEAVRREGPSRRRAGFVLTDRGIARQGARIFDGESEVGAVTSGSWSPTLEKAIGMAYLPAEISAPGRTLSIEVRGRRLAAEVVGLPFYKRRKAQAKS